MPPKRRQAARSDRQPQSPYAADLAVARSRVASFEASRTSSDADLDLLSPGPQLRSNLRAEAIARSTREASAPISGHEDDAAPDIGACPAPEQDECSGSEAIVGDAVAFMFAYTAGVRMLGKDCSVSPAGIPAASNQDITGFSEPDGCSHLELEPADPPTTHVEPGSHVAALRERYSRPGPPPSARHRMASPCRTPPRSTADPTVSSPGVSMFLDRNGSSEVLVATLSPRPEANGCCGESEQQHEACGRVVEVASDPACSTVLAVTVDGRAEGGGDGKGEPQSVPELSPVAEVQDDPTNARSPKGSPLTDSFDRLKITEAKDQDDDGAKRMKERLVELEAANLVMAEQLSARAAAADLIDQLAMSPGLLDSLGEILSPELRCKLRSTTSAGHNVQNDQRQSPELGRRRRKRASGGSGNLFRCCSAPQQVEN
jgi:hypothetical protein